MSFVCYFPLQGHFDASDNLDSLLTSRYLCLLSCPQDTVSTPWPGPHLFFQPMYFPSPMFIFALPSNSPLQIFDRISTKIRSIPSDLRKSPPGPLSWVSISVFAGIYVSYCFENRNLGLFCFWTSYIMWPATKSIEIAQYCSIIKAMIKKKKS